MYRNFEILRDFPYNNALFWIGTLPKNEQFAPENGWLEYDRFRPNFQGAFAVSFREGNIIWSNFIATSRDRFTPKKIAEDSGNPVYFRGI